MKRFLPGLLGLALASSAASASANGRFPQASQIAFDFVDGGNVVARTTFGVLVSHDHGKSFNWICEQVVGYSGNQDPGIGLFSDGSFAVAAFEGLSLTHDGGCSWALIGGGLENEYVIDVAVDRMTPTAGVAITSTGMKGGTFHVQAFETGDGGKTWSAVGVQLPTDLLAETIDVAPTDPQRLYVSGTFTDKSGLKNGAIEVSQDRGKTWTRTVLDLQSDQSIYIAGVDPTDAQRVYARTRGNGKDGVDGGTMDRLLVSKDGGGSFQQVTSIGGPMAGFAVSPDGTRVAIGSQAAGLLVASRDDLAFSQVAVKAVQCLAWSADGLYVCGSDFADGYVIGRTTDEGKTFEPLIPTLGYIGGPVACPATPQFDVQCGPAWKMIQEGYGIGTMGGGGQGGAGQGGSSGAGQGGSAGATGTGGAPNGEGTSTNASGSQCGCEIGPGRETEVTLATGLLAAILVASRRKRRDSLLAPVRE